MMDLLAKWSLGEFADAGAGPEALAERISDAWSGNRPLSARTAPASIAPAPIAPPPRCGAARTFA